MPTVNFGRSLSGDPADAMFNQTNFPGASTANLNAARGLYAMLTGRVSEHQRRGSPRRGDRPVRVSSGPSTQRAQLRDYGFFVSDTWRWKPNFTVNAGLRYVLQTPFYPTNNSYSTATLEDVWGVSGVDNIFKPGVLTGRKPRVHPVRGR